MLFKDILGLTHIKTHLTQSAEAGRIPHAQMFVGPEGCGKLITALAYAQYLLCGNTGGENTGGEDSCNTKCAHLSHPDLHFAFPVSNTDKVRSHAVSSHFFAEWRQFVNEQPYGNLFDWYQLIGIEKKQGQIGVDEAHDIVKRLSLKSYEGGYKVMLVWMAEKMNIAASNKLLKLIEEPPEKTIIILIVEDEEQVMQTIKSRCQMLHFPPLPEEAIARALEDMGINVRRHQCVGDDALLLKEILIDIAYRADLCIVTGGLGPTSDDLTSGAAAAAALTARPGPGCHPASWKIQ